MDRPAGVQINMSFYGGGTKAGTSPSATHAAYAGEDPATNNGKAIW